MDLQILWFCPDRCPLGGYFLLEGFDFGVGHAAAVPATERAASAATMFETIGPVWDGNEVWLVIAGGATFAAFPAWYATMFSGFYIALLLLLVLLIVRVLSFEWREKSESPAWRGVWAWANAIGSVGASLIWGIALASLLHGVPLDSKGDFAGNFADLFTGYSVLAGVTVVLVFAFHGATYLTIRTRGELCDRAARAARVLSVAAVVVGSGFLAWTVAVAVDRNDKDVFPPVLPAALGRRRPGPRRGLRLSETRAGWPSPPRRSGRVLLVATLFTSLYPRVMVSEPGLREQPHRLRRGVRALHAEGDLDRRRDRASR